MEKTRGSKKMLAGALVVIVFLGLAFWAASAFRAAEKDASPERLVVSLGESKISVSQDLKDKGFIKNAFAFRLASAWLWKIKPGAYKISKSENVWQIVSILSKEPYMKWVTIPEGLRKEEIADLLSQTLDWSEKEKDDWINTYTALDSDHIEGVYFPDTYLIPVEEAPLDVAKRLRAKFEEKFASVAKEAATQNIKWTTVVKIASIIQREAAGKNDMPLIAGIIWNRLDAKMKLDMDSTLQYARGDAGKGFWAPISVADKKTDSPYNTYLYAGLPPHPIANPGLSAIEAVLHPEKTDCLYYLHDNSGVIHCSATYGEQQANVDKYLK